jgi:hypothetical protein
MQSEKMAAGEFYKPEVVLDNVARSSKTEEGVIVISTRDLTGRIGVQNNSLIIGAVVDSTGETGNAALCKLLLLPYGSYTFRKAIPMDSFHLQQDLNLTFEDVKRFIGGRNSIGLANTAEQVLKNFRPGQNAHKANTVPTGDFDWETTGFRTKFDDIVGDVEYEPIAQPIDREIYESYMNDCNLILEAIKEKRTEEIEMLHVLSEPSKRAQEEALLKPGPLPTRKKKSTIKIEPMWVVAAACVVLGFGGFTMFSQNAMIMRNDAAQTAAAPEPAPAPADQAGGGAQETAKATPTAAGTAPYAFPAQSTSPPPNPAPPEQPVDSTADSSAEDDASSLAPAPTPVLAGSPNLAPAPAASAAGNDEVVRYSDAVRKNPGDISARRSLAYAYLVAGNAPASLEQFYTVMKVQKVDSSEIIEYADNMMAFCGRAAAKQFLTDMVRIDPNSTVLRQKLQSM